MTQVLNAIKCISYLGWKNGKAKTSNKYEGHTQKMIWFPNFLDVESGNLFRCWLMIR